MITEIDDGMAARAFYLRNYRMPFTFEQIDSANQEKRILPGPEPRRCRFCDRGVPAVTFRDVAHAVPESIGNRRLLSAYECDTCNRFCGSGIENHFVFRTNVTGRFGIVTEDFGNVTGHFGNVTDRTGRQDWRCA